MHTRFTDTLSVPMGQPFSLYVKSLGLVAAATLAAEALHYFIASPNLVIVYLLAVVVAALRLGLAPAVLTAVAGTLAFDFFFVPFRFSFTLFDREHIPTFLGLLIVSLVISSLVSTARKRADALFEREAETASLFRLSRDLAAAPDHQSLYTAVVRNAEASIASQAAIFHTADRIAVPAAVTSGMNFTDAELSAVEWAFANGHRSFTPHGSGADTDALICLPLVQAGYCLGVLALREPLPGSRSQRLVEGFVAQAASTLRRIELSHQAEQAQILQTRSNFERALLNSISHDLRTPLASVTGALSALRENHDHLSDEARALLLDTACSEADRLNTFVGNLLDLTRIEAGAVSLNAEPCELQELVGCALNSLEQRIGTRRIQVVLPEDLPLAMIDLVLMTQVLVNLLDNALKYGPEDGEITISASVHAPWLELVVSDRGPGIPEEDLTHVFEKFYRIPIPEGAGGTGLGLSICKGIVEAHKGSIMAENRRGGGVRMLVRLPMEGTGQ